jgi:hypothetical protein
MNISIVNPTGELAAKKNAAARSTVLEIQLRKNELYALSRNQIRRQVRAVEGNLWISQEGDPQDYLLEAGDTFNIVHRGMVVIEGFSQNNRVQIR